MIEMTAPPLPTLQSAVDALHARLTAGRVRATGTAVKTGLTGRVTDPTPGELAIIEDVIGGRWSATMSEIWMRDDLHVAGASEDDWALAKEITYQAIRQGLTGDELALTIERIMRAGPYRSKWDEARGGVSWLAQDVANAIQTTQERLRKAETSGPTVVFDDDPETTSDNVEATETPEQTVARLRRELVQVRTVAAKQQTIIRAERSEKEAAVETVRRIGDILAQPKEQMSPPTKILTIVAILETHSRASRGVSKLPSCVLEERSGMTKNMVSAWIQDLAARDGSPIKRRLTREWRTDEHGQQQPITVSEVIPLHATVRESMAAVLTMGGPSTKAQKQRAAAQERAGKSRLWGRCPSHDNDLVAVKGYCPDCGEVVGERVMRSAEFDALNPLNHEVRDSGSTPPTVDVRTKGHELRDSAPEPLNLLDYAATRPDDLSRPWRCVCGSLERVGGRCDGCGARDRLAVDGGQFVPSVEWQEVPDGYLCPPGGEFRMDFKTGKNWARWIRQAAVAGGSE